MCNIIAIIVFEHWKPTMDVVGDVFVAINFGSQGFNAGLGLNVGPTTPMIELECICNQIQAAGKSKWGQTHSEGEALMEFLKIKRMNIQSNVCF